MNIQQKVIKIAESKKTAKVSKVLDNTKSTIESEYEEQKETLEEPIKQLLQKYKDQMPGSPVRCHKHKLFPSSKLLSVFCFLP
jgi:hypothetical protein